MGQFKSGIGQARFIPGFCLFCSEEMLAHLFFMCAMLQSWLHFSFHIFIFTLLTQDHTKSWDFLINIHQPWPKLQSMAPGEASYSGDPFLFPCPSTPLGSAPLAITHQLCGHFQGVLSAIGGRLLPYGLLSSLFFLFCTFVPQSPSFFPFVIHCNYQVFSFYNPPSVFFLFFFLNQSSFKVSGGGLASLQQRKINRSSGHKGQGCCPCTSPAWQ